MDLRAPAAWQLRSRRTSRNSTGPLSPGEKYDLSVVVGEGDEAMEALAGEGEFSHPEDQILLAQELFQDIATMGKEALLKIPDGARVPASGKLTAEREEGPHDDTKWPFSTSQPPDHQGGQVAARPIPVIQRSHEDGLHLFRRTGTLNQDNHRVLHSSITISLQVEDLTRVPAGFLGPLHDCWDTTVLILEDSYHTPNEITILPEGKSVQLRLMADTGADVTIIPQARWPSDWELVPPCSRISGLGGAVHSLRSKHLVCVEGLEGQLATVRPFVVSSNILLLGRDVLSLFGHQLSSWSGFQPLSTNAQIAGKSEGPPEEQEGHPGC
ncbi:uncharacterized protein LOC128792464 [Vidua chalybeata]|uniref:uncharacterized protein LOC128792464 n=1 Tax=Vidua chalybeata TaxID=81927 RepID=UPI0023A830E1|nr:uncharacterized protein LOC128792464 [Vidua chalybeata]